MVGQLPRKGNDSNRRENERQTAGGTHQDQAQKFDGFHWMDFTGWISLGRLVEGNTPNQRRNQRQLPGGQAMGASLFKRDTTKKPSEKSMRLRFLPVKIHSKLNANAVFS